MIATHRPGVSLIELMIVVLIVSILVRLTVPVYQDLVNRARAAGAMADMHVVRVAAYAYNTDTNRWPPDVNRGIVPPELVPYLPAGFSFDRGTHLLDWDYWALPDGTPSRPEMGVLVGISLVTEETWLGEALVALLGDQVARYTIGEHYTIIIAGT